MDDNTETKILNMLKKKSSLQDQIKRYNDQLEGIQSKIDSYNEQIDDIESNIAHLRYNAAKKQEKQKDTIENSDKNSIEVEEEADAAITTGALDAASQSTGGDFGGWRHYSKIGDTQTRYTSRKEKKKNIYNYMDHLWDKDSNNS